MIFLALISVSVLSYAQTAAPVAVAGTGYELKDPTRGFVFATPNASWNLNAGQFSVSFTHDTHYDAYIQLKKSWYSVSTVQEAYDKRKESLKSYLPGAQILKDAESLSVGAEPALSMTYKDPAQQKIYREMVFIHKGVPYELSFTVKEENFEKVKADFGGILKGIQTL